MSSLLKMQADSETTRENGYARHFFCEEKYHHRMNRKIMSSEELGLVLVGFLQVGVHILYPCYIQYCYLVCGHGELFFLHFD